MEYQLYDMSPHSTGGYGYIIVNVDYFTRWAKVMPTFSNTSETTAYFFFNHIIARFGVLQVIVMDHEKLFWNHMMIELTTKLGISHESSTPYYPQANGQVDAINKFLKTMLQCMVGVHKSD